MSVNTLTYYYCYADLQHESIHNNNKTITEEVILELIKVRFTPV